MDAITRKPAGVTQTYFGSYDYWFYNEVFDDRLCPICLENSKAPFYVGLHLRAKFPYLEIVDGNRIDVKEHPNCRCFLSRVVEFRLYELIRRTLIV